jgi:hypothetical protein
MAPDQGDRIISLLRNAIRLSSRTYRDVERQLGWRAGTITRLMRGGLGLKIEHLLSILRAIKLSPARFFAVAYPTADGGRAADERLYRILEQMYAGGEDASRAAMSAGVATAFSALNGLNSQGMQGALSPQGATGSLGASGSSGSNGPQGAPRPVSTVSAMHPATAASLDHATTTQDEIDEMVRISLRKLLGPGGPDTLRTSRSGPSSPRD